MVQSYELVPEDQARIAAKLAELAEKTGRSWSYEITRKPQGNDATSLLEIAVDGRISKPIALNEHAGNPVDLICRELERSSTVLNLRY